MGFNLVFKGLKRTQKLVMGMLISVKWLSIGSSEL